MKTFRLLLILGGVFLIVGATYGTVSYFSKHFSSKVTPWPKGTITFYVEQKNAFPSGYLQALRTGTTLLNEELAGYGVHCDGVAGRIPPVYWWLNEPFRWYATTRQQPER